ncbi:MAG: LysE family translocator [Actinomycetota bacterium]|nr:LysE family translocator [Actinomycetota bacterium]
MIRSLIAFALVAGLVTVTPGADTMLVLSSAARGGVGRGLATAAGTVSGVYCWGLAAAAGASAVLTASQTAYMVLKLAGAAYLLWLGATALRSSLHRAPAADGPRESGAEPQRSLRQSYVRGLLTNLLNPKIGVFYISFLPQFVPHGVAVLPAGALLTSIHVLEGLLFLGAVSLLAHRAGGWLRTPKVSRVLDRVCATVFISFGLRLAVTR